MSLQAVALYDFVAESESELQLVAGETLSLRSAQDVDGWLHGSNAQGKEGLFPAAYVQVQAASNSSRKPPSLNVIGMAGESFNYSQPTSPSSPAPLLGVASTSSGYANVPGTCQPTDSAPSPCDDEDDWDDDWDDDDDDDDDYDDGAAGPLEALKHRAFSSGSTTGPTPSATSVSSSAQTQRRQSSSVGRTFNRFSTFVRSGGEAFVLGTTAIHVSDKDRIEVMSGPVGPEWKPNPQPFSCTIEEPTKQTKFKGMKSYIAYKVTASNQPHLQVSRRYKHFDWLHARLVEKFPIVCIPQLPEKQATGRFEADFIRKRRRGLALWLVYTAAHPILSQSVAFHHFLTSGDERAWKEGKRRAERDDLTGANFFQTVRTPNAQLVPSQVDAKMEAFKAFSKKMDDSVLQLSQTAQDLTRKHRATFKREFHRMGNALRSMGQAFEMDSGHGTEKLTQALTFAGNTYVELGDTFAAQPENDLLPLLDVLGLYQGLLANFSDILHVQKGAMGFIVFSKV
uniref:Sorting nexin 18 n=1 Tax=Eptatretus burgeri TaxID=7764 RepID=A0A8C4WYL6_EPTBU